MDVLRELNEVSRYIEEHITDDIDINKLAEITKQSSDSFSRLFSYMVGMTANEYIRRRKLSLAVNDLQNSDMKIIDIAMKYGWNSSDAFAKAFVNQHGTTPTNARVKSAQLKYIHLFPLKLILEEQKKWILKLLTLRALKFQA